MAVRRILLVKEVRDFKPLSITELPTNLYYRFDGEQLFVRWNNKIHHFPAEIGDPFIVKLTKETVDFPMVFQPSAPNDDKQVIMWLCGFNTTERTTDSRFFKKTIRYMNRAFSWDGYKEKSIRKKHEYCFVIRINPEDNYVCHLGAWIDSELDLTTDKVVEIMRKAKGGTGFLNYTDNFTRKILRNRFGLNEEHFEMIGFTE